MFTSRHDSAAFGHGSLRGAGHPLRGPGPHGFGRGFPPGFGPEFGGPRGRGRARRGDVRLALLSLLAEGPANGYSLIKAIAEKTEGRWRPSPGSVYPTLQQLVDEGLVRVSGEDRRSEFELTDEGRRYVEENAETISAAWRAATAEGDGPDELWGSFMKLATALRQLASEGTAEQKAQAAAKLDDLRRSVYGMLAE